MSRTLILYIFGLALASAANAQDGPYLYVTYSQCSPAGVAELDAVRAGSVHPALDAHVAAGDIGGWGYIAHHTGGNWTRANYYTAPTLDALMTFHDAFQAELGANHAAARDLGRRVCPTHEDYIWGQIASSLPQDRASERADAGASSYFTCNAGGLGRADTIVREAFVPILNELVASGELAAWRWHGHVMGGHYNRLLVLDGASHIANLRAIGRFNSLAGERHEAASREFGEICGSHQDYMWNVVASGPRG